MVGRLVDNGGAVVDSGGANGEFETIKASRAQSPPDTKTQARSVAPLIYVRNFYTQTRRVENMRHYSPSLSPRYTGALAAGSPAYAARSSTGGSSGGGGGRLLTKRQGAAQVVQIVGKMAPQAVSPKHGKSVDESCHSELPNGECDCSVSDASAVCEQDDSEKLQLEAVGERLACGQQQSRHLLEDTQRLLCRLELLKDELQEEQEERRSLQRLHETLDSQHEQLQQFSQQLQQQLTSCRQQLSERQTLLKKHGLVMVGGVTGELTRGEPASLVSSTSAQLLLAAGSGSLESRIRRLASERNLLENKIEELRKQLEVARAENAQRSSDELEMELLQHQAERLRQDYADKLKKSEMEQSSLQAEIHRLEAQVHRHRMHAQQAEANEDELRAEKRKLTKQLRESHIRIEELESYNEQLNKRMDKLNAVLKELSAPPTQRA